MKLDVRALALTGGAMGAALHALCALFVALAPKATVWAAQELLHLAVTSPPTISWTGALAGLLFWFAGTAAVAAAVASLYNLWARS